MTGRDRARELLGMPPGNGPEEECYRPLAVQTHVGDQEPLREEWNEWDAEGAPFTLCPVTKERYRGWFVGTARWKDMRGPRRTVREFQPYLWSPELFQKESVGDVGTRLLAWNPFNVKTIPGPSRFVEPFAYPRPFGYDYLARVEGGEFEGLTIGLFMVGIVHNPWDHTPDLDEKWARVAVDYLVETSRRPQ